MFYNFSLTRIIRYEDLCLDIFNKSKEIYDFLHLNIHKGLKFWLKNHTSKDQGGPADIFRHSKTTSTRWKTQMKWEDVNQIQSFCGKAISLWGYNLAKNKSDFLTFNPINMFSFP